jgi:hypothetical protein
VLWCLCAFFFVGNTATLLPSLTSLDVTPARLRLVDGHPALRELVGGNDELAVSVPQIKFVGGMRMTEIVKDLKLTGCRSPWIHVRGCVVYCEYASRFERYHQLGSESIDCR